MSTGSTTSPSASGQARSRSSPLTRAAMTSGVLFRAAPAVVPACTTCSLPARVMRSCRLDTADSLMVIVDWLPDATGACVLRGLTGRGQPYAGRRLAPPPERWERGGGVSHGPFGPNFLRNGPEVLRGHRPAPGLR